MHPGVVMHYDRCIPSLALKGHERDLTSVSHHTYAPNTLKALVLVLRKIAFLLAGRVYCGYTDLRPENQA